MEGEWPSVIPELQGRAQPQQPLEEDPRPFQRRNFQFQRTRIWVESGGIYQECPGFEDQYCLLSRLYVVFLHTCVPISVAVLENMPPMLAVARAMTTALLELVTMAEVSEIEELSNIFHSRK